MRKLLAWLLVVGVVLSVPLGATITIPNVFVPFTTISSSQVNANFSTVAADALDKRGDTMSGTLITQVMTPDTNGTRNLGSLALQYLNAWFSGTLTVGSLASSGGVSGTTGSFSSNVTVSGNETVTGTLGVTGTTTVQTLNASTLALSTPLPVSSGGTGGIATPTAGGVAAGTGTAYTFSGAGSPGQFLVSTGSGVPVWGGLTAVFNAGNSGTAITLNFGANGVVQKVVRNNNTTITLTTAQLSQSYVIELQHDGTGSTYTVAFSPTVKWPNGQAPTFTNTAGAIDIVTLFWDGATWFGVVQAAFA